MMDSCDSPGRGIRTGLLAGLALAVHGEAVSPASPWIDPVLFEAPKVEWRDSIGPDFELIYDNVPYQGKMARVLAHFSLPSEAAGKAPAMILVHGGAGQAFPQWTRQWADHGYAAIAMDLGRIGSTPSPDGRPWEAENFNAVGSIPIEDTWYYHAVSSIIRSVSFMAARPEVDSARMGIMGISWGGFLTSIVSGVDKRLDLAVPVYGCGFIQSNSAWSPITNIEYLLTFDPGLFLPRSSLPMLWVSGAPDTHYPLPIFRKSYRSAKGDATLHIQKGLVHGYETTWKVREILAFVDSHFKSGEPLPHITQWGWDRDTAWVEVESKRGMAKAELIYTRRVDTWKDFRTVPWESQPASLSGNPVKAIASIPEGARVFYLCVYDSAGNMVSSQHVDLATDPVSGSLVPGAARELEEPSVIAPGQRAPQDRFRYYHDLNGRRLRPSRLPFSSFRFPLR